MTGMWVRAGGRSGVSVLSGVVDAVVAVVVVAVFWVPSLIAGDVSGRVTAGVFLTVLVAAALLLRWRLLLVPPLVAFTATVAGWLLGVSTDPMLGTAWCLYPTAVHRLRRLDVVVGAGVLVVAATVVAIPDGGGGTRVIGGVVALGASVVLGSVEGRRLRAVAELSAAEAAEQQTQSQLAMSRDVHDVVGHALSVISAEADVARSLPDASEHDLRESLADIEHRARGALEEVQRLVRALRSGTTGAARVEDVTDASALSDLVAAARLSGLDVTASVNLPDVPPATSAIAVRVVQEALSNIVRHSTACSCEVALWPKDGVLTVRVDDDGVGFPAGSEPGTGLQGMRERVEGIGGALTVTDRLEGGARVLATLPLTRSA